LREWELSFRLGMRPWIAVAYSAPVAAASAVFLVYPIGQGSFSDGMPLGNLSIAPNNGNIVISTLLNGKFLNLINKPLFAFQEIFVLRMQDFCGRMATVNTIRQEWRSWRIKCFSFSNKTNSSGGNSDPNDPQEDVKCIPPEKLERGLKSLDNPVLRGSFTLVLDQKTMDFFLSLKAKKAFKEIMLNVTGAPLNPSSHEIKTTQNKNLYINIQIFILYLAIV
jgi:hypothetical protein